MTLDLMYSEIWYNHASQPAKQDQLCALWYGTASPPQPSTMALLLASNIPAVFVSTIPA